MNSTILFRIGRRLLNLTFTSYAAVLLALSAGPVSAELAVGNLAVKEGFKAELLYTVPQAAQGSWVAMTIDSKGRVIVSDQYGSLYRFTPPPAGKELTADQIEKIDLKIGNAQGLLYAFDSLYVMVANDDPFKRGLHRVRDTNGDDKFDEVTLLRELVGGGEHGPHAILKHPDGKSLTIIVGNQTRMTELSGSKVPKVWGEDILLPRLWDGNGFMKGTLGPGGTVYKIDPDGKNWELQAVGFRNEYDGSYNRDGELFVFDADMEWDMNTPWYRPTRVNHVVSGAEFGWRSGASKWPAYYPDSLGAVVNIGPGSPTGVTFGYGAKFPAKYQDALYISDWSYGKLYAVHLKPDGSTYTADFEEFLSGQPLALTDVEISPIDGAMYVAVGGRRTQSALYRVTYVGSESTKLSKGDSKGAKARALRRELEAFHGGTHEGAVELAWKNLNDKDRHIRFASRVALEWQPVTEWQQKVLTATDPQRIILGGIAVARETGRDEPHRTEKSPQPNPALRGLLMDKLDSVKWEKLDDAQRLDLLRAYTLVFTRHDRPEQHRLDALIKKFAPLFPTPHPDLNFELAQLLVYLQAPTAAEALVNYLSSAPTQEEQLNFAKTLRSLTTGWTPELQNAYFGWFLRAAAFKGGASLNGFIRDIKNDAVAKLNDEDKARLQPILEAKPEIKNPMELLAARSFVKTWTMADWNEVANSDLRARNFEKGRQLFGAVACSSCHRFAGEGGAVGPDLTGVSGRFSSRDLLESIIEPNKAISDQYGAIVIELKNGEWVTGRVANMNGDGLSIAENMLAPGDFTNVKRDDIVKISPSTTSPMPEGLLDTLSRNEVLDLVAYLMSQGDRNNKMFK